VEEVNNHLGLIEALTREDVVEFMNRHFDLERVLKVVLYPEGIE
jgi:predicted Zn-dependent peptidase